MLMIYLVKFIEVLFDLMSFAIIVRILLSWFAATGQRSGGQIQTVLYEVTEPVLGPFRKIIPRIGMIDISPLIALLVLDLVKTLLISVIISL